MIGIGEVLISLRSYGKVDCSVGILIGNGDTTLRVTTDHRPHDVLNLFVGKLGIGIGGRDSSVRSYGNVGTGR